jgi:hypothetical protein
LMDQIQNEEQSLLGFHSTSLLHQLELPLPELRINN